MKHSTKKAAPARKSSKPSTRSAAKPTATLPGRDPRLPAPGTTIVRPYKGKEFKVTVLDRGFRWEGDEYRSLSKLASVITGQASINGFLWFHLTEGDQSPKIRLPGQAPARDAESAGWAGERSTN